VAKAWLASLLSKVAPRVAEGSLVPRGAGPGSGCVTKDTLTVLLPEDWNGPAVEALLEHARRWFSSLHK